MKLKRLKRACSKLILMAGLATAFPVLAAQGYTAVDLGTPLYGGSSVFAYGVNNSGQVAGYSRYLDGKTLAFITGTNGLGITNLGTLGADSSNATSINSRGQVAGGVSSIHSFGAFVTGPNGVGMSRLGSLGGTWQYARAINSSGQVVGEASVIVNDPQQHVVKHAFVTGANGVGMTDLGALNGMSIYSATIAYGINDRGQVIFDGQVGSSSSSTYGFVTGANGVGLSLLTLGGDSSFARGINASGQVAGSAWTSVNPVTGRTALHAFVTGVNGANITDLGTLGGDWSNAYGINTSGQVVGKSAMPGTNPYFESSYHAFITGANGVGMNDLNSLVKFEDGIVLTEATGINDLGQVIANASNGHAYLLSVAAIPEPETYAILLAGFGLMGALVRRRKAA